MKIPTIQIIQVETVKLNGLVSAARALAEKLSDPALDKGMTTAFVIADLHGFKYNGPAFDGDLTRLKMELDNWSWMVK